jgi:hypothetical protein
VAVGRRVATQRAGGSGRGARARTSRLSRYAQAAGINRDGCWLRTATRWEHGRGRGGWMPAVRAPGGRWKPFFAACGTEGPTSVGGELTHNSAENRGCESHNKTGRATQPPHPSSTCQQRVGAWLALRRVEWMPPATVVAGQCAGKAHSRHPLHRNLRAAELTAEAPRHALGVSVKPVAARRTRRAAARQQGGFSDLWARGQLHTQLCTRFLLVLGFVDSALGHREH